MKLFTVPNILTLSNLFCGCLACILTIQGKSINVILLLILGSLIFDFLDGFVARLIKQSSEIGLQLDSLADVISFGLLPGLCMVKLFQHSFPQNNWIPFLGLMITLFSALRLAKFNIDTEQRYYFKGLNTPTNTIFILSLYYLYLNLGFNFISNNIFLFIILILSCWLLISDVPMMSLKFKGIKWEENQLIFSFLGICLLGVLIFQIYSIPILVVLYIILSIIFKNKIVK